MTCVSYRFDRSKRLLLSAGRAHLCHIIWIVIIQNKEEPKKMDLKWKVKWNINFIPLIKCVDKCVQYMYVYTYSMYIYVHVYVFICAYSQLSCKGVNREGSCVVLSCLCLCCLFLSIGVKQPSPCLTSRAEMSLSKALKSPVELLSS